MGVGFGLGQVHVHVCVCERDRECAFVYMCACVFNGQYRVATIRRLLKLIGLFCRISSLL